MVQLPATLTGHEQIHSFPLKSSLISRFVWVQVSFSQQTSKALTFIYKIGTSVIFPHIFHGVLSFVVESP